jgi:hypothetical protein
VRDNPARAKSQTPNATHSPIWTKLQHAHIPVMTDRLTQPPLVSVLISQMTLDASPRSAKETYLTPDTTHWRMMLVNLTARCTSRIWKLRLKAEFVIARLRMPTAKLSKHIDTATAHYEPPMGNLLEQLEYDPEKMRRRGHGIYWKMRVSMWFVDPYTRSEMVDRFGYMMERSTLVMETIVALR